jgi:hypothetical protein
MTLRTRGRTAWLVTWEWDGDHAGVADRCVVAAVLPWRFGPEKVALVTEPLFAQRHSP